jgi:hypothetical protein
MIKRVILVLGVILVVTVLLGSFLVFPGDREPGSGEETKAAAGKQEVDIQVPPPPFSEGIFPCSQCHADQETNPQRRVLEMHEEIVLNHGGESRWCLDCHDAKNRDMLHLAGGELVDFKESYLLCGQCHGPKLRDWRAGIHGRRTGSWNGQKRYLLCINCHNPHSPKFKKLKPEPPPVKPGRIKQ